jgi:hypothetical protein
LSDSALSEVGVNVQMMKFVAAVLFMWIVSCTTTQQGVPPVPTMESTTAVLDVSETPEPRADDSNLFTEVKSKTEWPSFSVEFHIDGFTYALGQNGRGNRTGKKSSPQPFNLRLAKDEGLDRGVFYARYREDLLLICESSTGEYGSGFVARLDGRTLKLKWKRDIPGFNVGQGLLHKDFVFVTAIGFVGQINVDSGVYLWKYDDLYGQKDSAFNSFEAPKVRDAIVRFNESENYLRKTLASLDVDIKTGKIMRVER